MIWYNSAYIQHCMHDDMTRQYIGHPTLLDHQIPDHKSLHDLDDIYALLNWKRIESILAPLYQSKDGPSSYPAIIMFRALLLQSWHNLSNVMLSKMLGRDLLFKRFAGFSIVDDVPDHSTFSRFKNLLIKHNLYDVLLQEVNAQLSEKGAIVKTGEISIIDATVIEAHQVRKKPGKHTENTQDPEAGWSVKKGTKGKTEYTYGFKAHTNVDEDGFVKKVHITAGNVHDSTQLENLLTGTEKQLYADSAYASKATNDLCKDRKIDNKVNKRAYRNKPLSDDAQHINQTLSSIRCVVERTFGAFKRHYGAAKTGLMGRVKNECWITLISIAHNIKKAQNILAA